MQPPLRHVRRGALVAMLLAPIATARADSSVVVDLNPDGQALADQLGVSVPELIQHCHDKIDEIYQTSNLANLLRSFGNTASFANRGLGIEYDVDPGDVMVGAVAVGALATDVALGSTSSLFGGANLNFAAMAGVNLARWHHPRWTTFANGFYEQTTIHGMTGHLLTVGAHVQYQVIPPQPRGGARWTGIAATTGLEYGKWTISASAPIDIDFTAEGPNGKKNVDLESTGTLTVTASVLTVPLELTTGVRLADVLALYGGVGVALTTGTSTVEMALQGEMNINSERLPIGTAMITASGTRSPSLTSVHALIGLEVHTRHARVYVQTSRAPGETAYVLGLRVAL